MTWIATMPGRLNIFQRTMLLWNDLHPYNSVHAVRLKSPLDLSRLQAVVIRTLQAQGLANLTLQVDAGTYRYGGGEAKCEIKFIQASSDPRADLRAEAERQLNAPFAVGQSFTPIRFFVVDGKDSFYFGLVYFHAVADGEAVVNLLKRIVDAYVGKEDSSRLELYPKSRGAIAWRNPVMFAKKLRSVFTQLQSLRRSQRPPCRDLQDQRNAALLFSLAPEELQALQRSAKSWNVTLNDLFLALLLQAFAAQRPRPEAGSRRTKLAVGCIVNLRKDLGVAGSRIFGLFLGSFVVTCEPQSGLSLREWAEAVRQQTARIKQNRLYVGAPLELHLARLLLRHFSLERRRKFYLKNHPLWGGITNMNLDSIWPEAAGGRPAEYLRVVSTGPATPLVLAITTARGGVNIGLTYRTAFFSAPEVEAVKQFFLDAVRQLRTTA